MKPHFASLLKHAAVASTLLAAPGAAAAADLTLDLTVRAHGGRIAIAVYDTADGLRRGRGAVRTLMAPRAGERTLVVLRDLPPGRYVVAAFHDADENGELTLWPIGMPKEAYGFSRDARGRFGPPPFDQAAFDLPAAGARQAFTLR